MLRITQYDTNRDSNGEDVYIVRAPDNDSDIIYWNNLAMKYLHQIRFRASSNLEDSVQ